MDLRGVDIEALPEELGAFSPGAGIDWLVALIAPEGLQDSAQGFNPGEPSKQMVRPERARDNTTFRVPSPSSLWLFRTFHLPPLQGATPWDGIPGVETPG